MMDGNRSSLFRSASMLSTASLNEAESMRARRMSASSVEEIKKHVKVYKTVGGVLLVLTVVTVLVSYIQLIVPLAVTLALIVAITKGSMVASVFMHLSSEKKLIYGTLVLTAVFFLVLMFIPILGMVDRVGEFTE